MSYQNELTRSGLAGEEDAWLSNFGDNILEFFSTYNVKVYPRFILTAKRVVAELSAHSTKLTSQLSTEENRALAAMLRVQLGEIQGQIETVMASITRGGEARMSQLTEHQKALHDAAFVTNTGDPGYHALDSLSFESEKGPQSMKVPRGDILYQFRKDVNEGKLPTVSWLRLPKDFPIIRPRRGMEPGTSPR